jgi:hypothetical protein
LKYVNELLYNELNEYKTDLMKLADENKILKKQFSCNNRYELLDKQFMELSDEFSYYRFLANKEVSGLKFDLEKIISERDMLRTELIRLKEFFYKFNV